MSFHGWVTLLAMAGELALGLHVLLRGRLRAPSIPLALLSFDLFATNLAAFTHELTGTDRWRPLYLAAAPMVIPLGMHLVLSFVGRSRRLRWVVVAAYAGFGLFSLLMLASSLGLAFAEVSASRALPIVLLLGLLVPLVLSLSVLVLHMRATVDPEEKERTWLLLCGVAVFTSFGATNLLVEMGVQLPRLGSIGSVLFILTLSLVAMRLRLFEDKVRSRLHRAVLAASTILFVALAYLSVFRLLGANVVVLTAATAGLSLGLLGLAYRVFSSVGVRRARLDHLATLGRFSAQMAHDLKNPLASMKGAVQFLEEERHCGRSIDSQTGMLELMRESLERMHRVVEKYQRLSRVEPAPISMDVNRLVMDVLALQSLGSGKVSIRSELAPLLPRCSLDADLISPALENLLQNAVEAMPEGGRLTVRTRLEENGMRVAVEVQDEGHGMDARTRERAFDDFFTTKMKGSGLGLSFVRRVVESHGGAVALTSEEGQGTVVTLLFTGEPAGAGSSPG